MKIGEVGETGTTRALAAAIQSDKELSEQVQAAWARYTQCDWGNLEEEDKQINDNAVSVPGSDRIIARYPTKQGEIYIITEHDRSYTTIMFCNEY